MKYQNPVLRGMYPDPSICRAGDKFYMVTSTFQWFPGVPVFESEDCINWRQVGHCLTRKSQLLLTGAGSGAGIFAPTIRFNNGRFYMVVTNVSNIGNFYVYTDDIYGEWSEPVKVKQDGIDPSLYFEKDKVFFISNGSDILAEGAYIQMCEINIETGEALTESRVLWQGTGGRYLEAPHLYKIGDYYYLVESEGGTEYGHMVNYARSKNIWGPYEPYKLNPVLTNRNLGGYELQAAGHADLVEDSHGNWWMIHLAFRQLDKYVLHHHLGRETCVEPVVWDQDGWFRVGVNGTARLETELPESISFNPQSFPVHKTFETLSYQLDWCHLRNAYYENYRKENTYLELIGTKHDVSSMDSPSLLGIRQDEFETDITVCVENNGQEAGLSLYQSEHHHYDFFVREDETGSKEIILRSVIGTVSAEVGRIEYTGNCVELLCRADKFRYHFYVMVDGKKNEIGFLDTRYLSSEVDGGFTGVFICLYAVDPKEQGRAARFTNFSVKNR